MKSSQRTPCAILGSGNIGMDLMTKLLRSERLELTAVIGIDEASEGLVRARVAGLDTSAEGVDWLVHHGDQAAVVFDATSAAAHRANVTKLHEAGLRSIDLTPSRLGPGVVPVVNLGAGFGATDISLVSCGGQATIPIVAAVARICEIAYSEVVATIASLSAGPGTRQNIDEFTHTTARGLEEIGGALAGKAIIVLNPAEPPILMRNTVYASIPADVDREAVVESILIMVDEVATYVPGYRLRGEPLIQDGRVTVFLEIEGAGDYLPRYAGNLDIMTSAAVHVGEELVRGLAA